MSDRLAVVVVHWRDVDETRACLGSLAAEPPDDVIVVDNGGREPLALADAPVPARIVRLEENRGYAGGANAGIAVALESGARVVLVLNNDARRAPGAQAAARRALAADSRIAVVGAKVVTREDPRRLWLAWGRVTYRQSLVALVGADASDGPDWNVERDVDWVAGCAMWLRSSALRALGSFDATFFAYHEEVDWCARARERGWRVVYSPAAVVSHTGRGSHGDPAAIRIRKYFAARNTILYAQKHAGALDWMKLAAFLGASLPLELAWHLARGDAGDVLMKLRGVRDAVLGREPPYRALELR